MRDIKFRVWCKNKNDWEKDIVVINSSGMLFTTVYTNRSIVPLNPKTHIIEQFTGLQDKNGKDIYDGDIVLVIYTYNGKIKDRFNAIVELDICNPSFVLKRTKKYERCSNDIDFDFVHCDMYDLSVIGNIHENKLLLEETK